MIAEALRALAFAAGLFCGMSGFAFFVVGLLPGKSAPWYKQYGYAAVAITGAFYLLRYAFTG